ncbi:MAG: hypothetical protein QOD63_153 [Actinomycetota bacterium]|jgi:hypothetical protein|nr:hypothetical protein [Actinomycetota bacterium]
MRRVLAVVAAAAMIAGALFVRSALDDRKEEKGRVYSLVCSDDLAPACDEVRRAQPGRVDVTVEPAGVTADRLVRADGDPGLDGWLVTAPWREIVDGTRRSRGQVPIFGDAPPAVARSPLVLVAWKERADALASRCKPLTWKCLGEAAATPGGWGAVGGRPEWGPVKPGHADASADGQGLLVLGAAAAEYFGRTDLSTIDLDDDGFQRWLTALERATPPSPRSPLARMLQVGPAAFDAVGTTKADARAVERAARRDALTVLYPAPMVTADVVLTTVPGDRGDRLRDTVTRTARDALLDAGWDKPDAGGLPPTDGLPTPGLLDALRARAREATGR